MPSLGADMDSGTLVEWLKKPGDRVRRGDIIAVVETQKGAIEIEVFQTGVVETLLTEPGRKIAVGAPMAFIRGDGEKAAAAVVAPSRPAARAQKPAPAVPPRAIAAPPIGGLRVSPAARRRAEELRVALDKLTGTGPEGSVTFADVERAAKIAPSAAKGIREVIGSAMARSKREIPHYYLGQTVDLDPALTWLAAENARRPVPERLLYGVLLLRAVAHALRDHLDFNGFWVDGGFRRSEKIHLGVAISLRQGGLIAPAIHDADSLSLSQLMTALRDLVSRARKGGLRSSELSDPTITVTSLGEEATELVFPVIYPPQVAIVGFGTVQERPWVVAGTVRPRRVILASLAGDHRVSDGHQGARFLAAIARRLQEPPEP